MAYKKIEEVSNEFWENEIREENREIIEDFLGQRHLSPNTIKQYRSALRIFAKWLYDKTYSKKTGEEKLIVDLKPRDALAFQNWMIDLELSNNSIKLKRSAVSSLCGYIEVYYSDMYPNFRNIYSKAVQNVPKTTKKEKLPLTGKEIEKLVRELKKREEWQKLAYLLFTYRTGCRREEARQLLKEVADYKKHTKEGKVKPYYLTHMIRAKGKGREGVPRRFKVEEVAMIAIRKWVEQRALEVTKEFTDDCPYLFVSRGKDGFRQVTANTFNLWCDEFSEILGGRPVHPHLFRSSRATNAHVEEGKDIKSIQKMLGHSSADTTQIYIIQDDSDDDDELYE